MHQITNSINMITSSSSKTRVGTSFGKSTKKSLGPNSNKISRDLLEQFDDYVLRQEQQQGYKSDQQQNQNNNEQGIPEAQDHHYRQPQLTRAQQKFSRSATSLSKKQRKQNLNKSKVNQKPKRNVQNYKHSNIQVPKSYLMAMEHLQDLLGNKNQEINQLKICMLQKQQIILQCQSRINEVLHKYHQLMDMFSLKENQVAILKQQMEELRHDKQTALKQAAKVFQSQFKPYPSQDVAFSTFKQRSISVTAPRIPVPHLSNPRQSTNITINSKQLFPRVIQQNLYRQLDKTNYELLMTKNFEQSNPSSRSPLIPVVSATPLLSHKSASSNRDFISYQREILRNQKELIALKYRMECLERKLGSDKEEKDGIKQKIKKLSQEIETKERTVNELKRV